MAIGPTFPIWHRVPSRDALGSARALLGPDHPLVRVLDTRRVLIDQSFVVLGVTVASAMAAVAGVSHAIVATAAAVVAQLGLAGTLAILTTTKRARLLDLLIEGRDRLPLGAVERERDRLLDIGHRTTLARSLDGLRREAEHPRLRPPSTQPLYAPRVIAAVAPDLAWTARLLSAPDAAIAGVAMTEQLLGGSRSPLFGTDVERLRQELRAINFRLQAARPPNAGRHTAQQ
jgi:hypothetical protein